MEHPTCCGCASHVREYTAEDWNAHAVEPQPESTSRRSFLKIVVGAGGLLAVEEVLAPNVAEAIGQPSIAGTGAWGARPPRQAITLLSRRPTYLVVHHTAGANSTDYSRAHAYAVARQIQQGHFARGFIDSGQQFTNSRGGYLMEGRHRSLEAVRARNRHVLGAHVENHNSETIGIENEGLYTSVQPPQALKNSLIALSAWICQQYNIGTNNIRGHRDFNATACPGNRLYAWLPTLRTEVRRRLGG